MKSLINILMSAGVVIFRGFVVRSMWTWFVLTQFTQAPALSLAGAIGLSVLAGMFTISASDLDEISGKRDDDRLTRRTVVYLLCLLILWAQAYIVHLFM